MLDKNENQSSVKLIMPRKSSSSLISKESNVENVAVQLDKLKYPIANHAEMMSHFRNKRRLEYKGKHIEFGGIDLDSAAKHLPSDFYPVKSSEDFEKKLEKYIN